MSQALEITQLLDDYREGDDNVLDTIFPIVYQELRQIAHRQLRNSWSAHTINTTALVNEAYIKLFRSQSRQIENRVHFFSIAATAMRQILINYAEQQQAKKRGGEWRQVTLEDSLKGEQESFSTLVAVDKALAQVKSIDEELAQLVELRFFAGMTDAEIASVLKVSDRTVRRNWLKAKALLSHLLV